MKRKRGLKMKNYGTKTEFILGLAGVILHTFVVMFIVAYLANPVALNTVIASSSGYEKEMLLRFVNEVNSLNIVVYAGSAIVVFEWMAIFRILKYSDKMTPFWAIFLILGALYAYFYFGGLEVFILLFLSGIITLIKYSKYSKQ